LIIYRFDMNDIFVIRLSIIEFVLNRHFIFLSLVDVCEKQ
jgi:hypothetical protein